MTAETTTCDWCGKEFTPTPDCFTESGFSILPDSEDIAGEEWKGEPTVDFKDATPAEREAIKQAMNLSDEQVQELLEGGSVMTGFSCICLECQDDCDDEDPT